MAVTNKTVPYYKASGPVRGTQSFVHTLSSCWSRPSLTGLEVLWRWAYGIPALWLTLLVVRRALASHLAGGLAGLGLDKALLNDPVGALTADPMGVVAKVEQAAGIVMPDLLRVAAWLAPLLVAVWIVVSSIGRTVVLRRADSALKPRVFTLMLLQVVRLAALAGSFWVWFSGIRFAARVAVIGPMSAGQEPNLVLYCAISIVTTLGLFVLWGAVSWFFSIAPLLAMIQGLGVAGSLKAALRLGSLKSKLVEINLVMGIVKIGLIVLAMVFSATPLPFQTVTTPGFLACWWAGVTVLYLVGSDFFHVARLVAYLNLWRGHEEEISLPDK
ncbi:hypothetical protein HDF16_002580 [Granulicella aggregans]|uniref:Uncharacterized protein n=1 Tax=Granulicella aggregans TaxID=474949 RepID=A0A7W8E429_9BACT|nr:hypothetical protein [Granulicella aggregans]MBB5057874.1 hypothetical protein [Granulicella aggregans]